MKKLYHFDQNGHDQKLAKIEEALGKYQSFHDETNALNLIQIESRNQFRLLMTKGEKLLRTIVVDQKQAHQINNVSLDKSKLAELLDLPDLTGFEEARKAIGPDDLTNGRYIELAPDHKSCVFPDEKRKELKESFSYYYPKEAQPFFEAYQAAAKAMNTMKVEGEKIGLVMEGDNELKDWFDTFKDIKEDKIDMLKKAERALKERSVTNV